MDSKAPESLGPKRIKTALVENNPENPRLIFDPVLMDELKASISEVGILVPLIVYPTEGDKYILLDGQRRLTCAKELNHPDVPVNIIAPPTKVENILRMFNIHKVIAQWDLMPTALSLEKLMDYLHERGDARLAQLTGMTMTEVRRCKILLSFSDRHRKMVLEQELKTDFLIEMYPVTTSVKRVMPKLYEEYAIDGLADAFIKMWEAKKMKAVTDFRKLSKILNSEKLGVSRDQIYDVFEKLFKDKSYSFDDAYADSVGALYVASDLNKLILKVLSELKESELEPKSFSKQAELVRNARKLRDVLDDMLSRAG